ncbi:MAG TPA: AAA family ATPase, partial [Microlunatus sp.]|nr:AAA family ATPase [Microlunatus sp.]
DLPADQFRRALRRDDELDRTFTRAWTLIEAADLVGDLWSVPAYLRRCAPWLSRDEVRALQRAEAQDWTVSDLPLLDAARHRLGDPEAVRRNRRREAALAEERAIRARVTESIMENLDGYAEDVIMLKGADLQEALIDRDGLPSAEPDLLTGPFAHVIVDEAQELTDAEWQMLLRRCPSRSFTIVGDRAQARHGFTESWSQRLERVGFDQVALTTLTVNYRTPEEVMIEAEPVIRAAVPNANVPASIRSSGLPVIHGARDELEGFLRTWLASHPEGTACVIGDPSRRGTARVRSLSPQDVKGLEFDLVVLVEPETYGEGIEGAVDRYVAMTRATQQLVILSSAG